MMSGRKTKSLASLRSFGKALTSLCECASFMGMMNAEQYEVLREIIHRQATTFGAAPPLHVLLTGPAGCGKTFVLRLVMDV
ncbi:hypothetical protein HPB50_008705 [Hyalomma asiaticum]|uniref:Uncharacterized protein n=1 Tax=Hyalomma asiaticum TaxID=266040 RepID=A0ACB7SD91_HYAAI|nr:hypothetical protein HPB50_008705 [Hyalomma asiaticum]